jgi:hypothetical protein
MLIVPGIETREFNTINEQISYCIQKLDYMKRGGNPYILFNHTMYVYRDAVNMYYEYKDNIYPKYINREEVISLLEIYLRRVKLEKICSKLVRK